MRTGLLCASLIGCIGIVASSSAQTLDGIQNCGKREALVERLERTFGEVQKGAGLVSGAQLLEVWGSEETGTWTILMTHPDGHSCVLAAGEAWRDVEGEFAAKGDPT